MKKLVFLFAMVFAVSMTMAQTAFISQTSENEISMQEAEVSQTGISSVNITQQTGKIQSNSSVDPVGSPAAFNNKAKATQFGGDGNSIVVQQVAEEYIWGSDVNTTEATQNGSSNILYQTQISGNHTSGGMVFTATQIKDGNHAEQYSKKTNGIFSVYQDGSTNQSYQKTTGEKTGNLAATVQQVGDINKAWQTFHGQNVRNAGAEIYQYANNNTATQDFDLGPDGVFYNPNSPSAAKILQVGDDNTAYQQQVGQGSYQDLYQSGTNNTANMWSYGNYNKAEAIQAGSGATLNITQKQDYYGLALSGDDGKGNFVMISQNGDDSKASIYQDGFQNEVVGLSGSGYAINNNGAQLYVSQEGMLNTVQSYQNVAGSETVNQNGMNNMAIVNQY